MDSNNEEGSRKMKLSLKNKLWWAQNKDKITRIGIISITAFILVVSVIYFTYSKFTAKNETTVEKFTKKALSQKLWDRALITKN